MMADTTKIGRKEANFSEAILLGAVYAAGLFFLGWAILLPASGSALRQLPGWDFGLAHLAYGVSLGYLVYRRSLGN